MNFSFLRGISPHIHNINIIVHHRENYNYKTATISLLFRVDLHFSAKCMKNVQFILHVKAKNDNITVAHDIFLALGTNQSLLLCSRHRTARHQVVIRNDFRTDKAALKSVWIFPAACGALVPFSIVHARTSFGPAVKKLIRPSRS